MFENQHKLGLVVRWRHQMRAVQEPTHDVDFQPESGNNKVLSSIPKEHKSYVPENLSTKRFHVDREYQFPEVKDYPQRSFTVNTSSNRFHLP